MSLVCLPKETYIKMVENSIGSCIFNSLYARDDNNKVVDILGDGDKSCAVFVSSILALNGLIDGPHATVKTLIKKLNEYNYEKVKEDDRQPGDIIHWAEWEHDEKASDNHHIGFYVGNDEAVSTIWQEKKICKHHYTYGVDDKGNPKRKIISLFRPRI